jgi:hypothetical protein
MHYHQTKRRAIQDIDRTVLNGQLALTAGYRRQIFLGYRRQIFIAQLKPFIEITKIAWRFLKVVAVKLDPLSPAAQNRAIIINEIQLKRPADELTVQLIKQHTTADAAQHATNLR